MQDVYIYTLFTISLLFSNLNDLTFSRFPVFFFLFSYFVFSSNHSAVDQNSNVYKTVYSVQNKMILITTKHLKTNVFRLVLVVTAVE